MEAIKSSANAFKEWKKTSAEERSYFLKTFHSLVLKNKKSIAQIITKESGKPLKESYVEVEYGASFIEWSANQCLRNCGKIFESPEQTKRMFYVKQPVGVVAAITPGIFLLQWLQEK